MSFSRQDSFAEENYLLARATRPILEELISRYGSFKEVSADGVDQRSRGEFLMQAEIEGVSAKERALTALYSPHCIGLKKEPRCAQNGVQAAPPSAILITR